MTNIPLHKDRGLDPHLTFCPRCQGETNELTVGEIKRLSFVDGRIAFCNRGDAANTARKLGYEVGQYTIEPVDEWEKLPASEPCEACKEELETHFRIVAEGGIYFVCEECACEGVVKPSLFTQRVRDSAGIQKPAPVGIRFSHCSEHK